jgi:hypothetical protein
MDSLERKVKWHKKSKNILPTERKINENDEMLFKENKLIIPASSRRSVHITHGNEQEIGRWGRKQRCDI